MQYGQLGKRESLSRFCQIFGVLWFNSFDDDDHHDDDDDGSHVVRRIKKMAFVQGSLLECGVYWKGYTFMFVCVYTCVFVCMCVCCSVMFIKKFVL